MIPEDEVWLKIGGDKGGCSFKMSFQLGNVSCPNSLDNTCVFAAFNPSDSPVNLPVSLQRYREEVTHLQSLQFRYHAQNTIK